MLPFKLGLNQLKYFFVKHISVLITYFTIIVLIISLFVNFGLCYNNGQFLCLIALRNVYLYLMFLCFIFRNKFTLALLVFLNALFWFHFLQFKTQVAYFNYPIAFFTHNLYRLLRLLDCNKSILGFVITIPFMLNLIFSFIEIPYRIYLMFNKNKII